MAGAVQLEANLQEQLNYHLHFTKLSFYLSKIGSSEADLSAISATIVERADLSAICATIVERADLSAICATIVERADLSAIRDAIRNSWIKCVDLPAICAK